MPTKKKKTQHAPSSLDLRCVLKMSDGINFRLNPNGTIMLLKTDESGLFYKSDAVAAEVLLTMEKPTSGQELIDIFSKLYPKEKKQLENDITSFLSELLSEKLISVFEGKSSHGSAAPKKAREAGYEFGELKKFNLEEIETEVLNESIYLDVFAGSDQALKVDIQPLEGALSKVVQLDGVNYRWNKTRVPTSLKVNTKAKYAGLIAQQVATLMPELVRADKKTGFLAVEYSKLSSYLVEAIKELHETNARQEKRIKKLEQILAKKNG